MAHLTNIGNRLFKIFDQGWTYLFELCCEQNQVVNKYTQVP
jgi:hypothetical protein